MKKLLFLILAAALFLAFYPLSSVPAAQQDGSEAEDMELQGVIPSER